MDALLPARPVEELQFALSQFCAVLTDDQRHDLSKIRTVPDVDSILVFTAQLDAANRSRRGRSVGSRVSKVLHSTRDFCTIIDTFVSSHPEIASLVWGSIKLTMQIIVNYTSYYEAISGLFMQLGQLCPLFAEYRTLYQSSKQLQNSLSDFHASIVRCCKHVVEAIQRPWHSQVLQSFYRSFDQEFKPDTDDIRRCSDSVKDAINLAKAYVDVQEQRLQCQERTAALESRNLLKAFVSRTGGENDKLHELLLQREEREAQDRKQRLLEALCAYNPERLLKQNQRKRFHNTASWIHETQEFRTWVEKRGPPLLWCSGKIGSGKTVVALVWRKSSSSLTLLIRGHSASVIDYLFLEKGSSNCLVSYFFTHSSDRESLNVETVMRSLLRQRLPLSSHLSHDIELKLQHLSDDCSLDRIAELLCDITQTSRSFYIVIDGLDECETLDRNRLLKALSLLVTTAKNTKLFLASRESISGEIQKCFPSIEQISMDHPRAQDDVTTYINGILQEKRDLQELRVGDPSLITEIEQALNRGADGMFLWVFFQVHEICEQTCDEDIRQTIANLPEGLEETFIRILRRIASRRHGKLAQKVLPWIAASVRPLFLEEVREAVTIEIDQPYSKPGRLCNDKNDIVLACQNLVHVDEEDQSIQFAHHSIQQFLVRQPSSYDCPTYRDLAGFFIDVEKADHFIGEICITYLDFNDFKTALSQRAQPIILPSPPDIALTAIGPEARVTSRLFRKFWSTGTSTSVDIDRMIKSNTYDPQLASQAVHNAHPFLRYASSNWVLHTKNFRYHESRMFRLWEHMVTNGHDLAIMPWESGSSNIGPPALKWAQQANHIALIYLIASSRELSDEEKNQFILRANNNNNSDLIAIVLQQWPDPLLAAAKGGYLNIIERLLSNKTDIWRLFKREGWISLQAAAQRGHLAVVERLVAAEADAYAPSGTNTWAILQAAARTGDLAVIERLLAKKVDVDFTPNNTSWTALQGACQCGHLNVVERLLAAGAKVDYPASIHAGRTALQAACESGHLQVVDRLLQAGADVSAPGALYHGQTAARLAIDNNHYGILERLRAAGADDLAPDAVYHDQTALGLNTDDNHHEMDEMRRADETFRRILKDYL
ncbi:hypothetical protein F5Y12DRAFT_390745 [Xylaria sp. FL1777]|nr:hypothetical protein F5Y12DRAFT_390745 [Xylaria sp. FL1777]